MNSVYKPVGTIQKADENDPNSKNIFVPTTDSFGRETIDKKDPNSHPYKDFPQASANPGLLDVVLGNYEDTIFLGEDVTPGKLFSNSTEDVFKSGARDSHRVADTAYNSEVTGLLGDTDNSSAWFIEYLERAGQKLHDDEDYYAKLFQHIDLESATGVQKLVEALKAAPTLYDFSESGGSVTATGKEGTTVAGERIVIQKGQKVEITVPYYYLKEPGNSASYAGDANKHGADKVGTLTYTWEAKQFPEAVVSKDSKDEANKFVKFDTYVNKDTHMDTTTVQYQLTVKYEPDLASSAASGNDGSDRTKVLTGQQGVEAPLIRDAVGNGTAAGGQWNTTAETTDQMGWAVIHVVDGRIKVEKRMSKADYEAAIEAGVTANMTFTLTGEKITSEPADEVVWTGSTSLAKDATQVGDEYILYTGWASGLPLGNYKLSETIDGGLEQKEIKADTAVEFMNDADPAKPYDGTATDWAAEPSSASGPIPIGITPDHTPVNYVDSTLAYGTSDASDNTVKADLAANSATPKNIDPALRSSKDYLNAQLGHIYVLNQVKKADFTVDKYLKDLQGTESRPTNAIKFTLYKATESEGNYTKGDEVATKAIATSGTDKGKAAFKDLMPGTYILEEDASTVDEGYSSAGPWIVTVANGAATIEGDDNLTWNADAKTAKILNVKAQLTLRINKKATQLGTTETTPLEGATFKLHADAGGQPADSEVEWWVDQAHNTPGSELVTAIADGATDATATAYGLKPDTTFWIVETSAPAGYQLADPVKVVLDASGNAKFYTKDQSTGEWTVEKSESLPADATYEREIIDSVLYELPAAGGPGAAPFLFAGAFVAALAAGMARSRSGQPSVKHKYAAHAQHVG